MGVGEMGLEGGVQAGCEGEGRGGDREGRRMGGNGIGWRMVVEVG